MDDVAGAPFLLFGLVTGIRHGIDVDHIAAITDIVSSQRLRARGLFYSTLYAVGHGVMVVLLGILVLTIGQSLPDSVDRVFGKIVGATLIVLGAYVLWSLVGEGSAFKLKSRWMLIFDAIKFGYHKLLHNFNLSHHHPKLKEEKYGAKTAFGVGLIHGIGAETPTQIAALAVLLGIGSGITAVVFLFTFVAGIFVANVVLAAVISFGYLRVWQQQKFYMLIGILTAVFSVVVGVIFLR